MRHLVCSSFISWDQWLSVSSKKAFIRHSPVSLRSSAQLFPLFAHIPKMRPLSPPSYNSPTTPSFSSNPTVLDQNCIQLVKSNLDAARSNARASCLSCLTKRENFDSVNIERAPGRNAVGRSPKFAVPSNHDRPVATIQPRNDVGLPCRWFGILRACGPRSMAIAAAAAV